MVTVSGTIITETGVGTFRQPWTISRAGYRTLYLPWFAVAILLRRQGENRANPQDAVFPTRRGTWRQISNWERMWNQVVDDTAYDWVTLRTAEPRSVPSTNSKPWATASHSTTHPEKL